MALAQPHAPPALKPVLADSGPALKSEAEETGFHRQAASHRRGHGGRGRGDGLLGVAQARRPRVQPGLGLRLLCCCCLLAHPAQIRAERELNQPRIPSLAPYLKTHWKPCPCMGAGVQLGRPVSPRCLSRSWGLDHLLCHSLSLHCAPYFPVSQRG